MCTGSIFGAGAGRRLASVRWGIAGRIALAWSFTLPSAAVVGAAASWLAATGTAGVIVVAVTGVALAAGIYVASRRNAVTAANVNDVPAAADRRPRPRRLNERASSVNIDWGTWPRSRSSPPPPRSPSSCWWPSRSSRCPARPGAGRRPGRGAAPEPTAVGTAVAGLCLVAAGLIVCFGLYLIIA